MNRIYTPGMTVINADGAATATYVTHKPNDPTPGADNANNMASCIVMASVTNGTLTINTGTYKHSTSTFTADANPRLAYVVAPATESSIVFIGHVTKNANATQDYDTSCAFQIVTSGAAIGNVYIEGKVLEV